MTRCSTCYRPLDAAHRALGRCPTIGMDKSPVKRSTWTPPAGYRPPCRSYMLSRDEYLESVRTTPEQKKALRRARQAAWRQKRAAK